MNFTNNKKNLKIIFLSTVSVGILVVVLSFNTLSKISNNQKNLDNETSGTSVAEEKKVDSIINETVKTQLERSSTGKEDMIDGTGNGTAADHWKVLGMTNANVSSEEEKELYLKTVESIKAQSEYYSTGKDESLEKVKDLYLPEAFAQYKEYAKREASSRGATSGNQAYNKIKIIKFSKPRAYKDLSGRVGIINYVRFTDNYTNTLNPIFIFKNINGEWKIEKQREIDFLLSDAETILIQEIEK